MKKIILKKDCPYSVQGGVLTVGDVNAYSILIDMGTDTSSMTAMAICQENGEFSADYFTEGSFIGVTLASSMYSNQGYITVRLSVSEGDGVLTACEVLFRVMPPNNTETMAETTSGTLSDILTSVQRCESSVVTSNQALALVMTKADADSVYTRAEVDSILSSVYRYKGSVDSFSRLPASPEVGDVYNIKNGCTKRAYAVDILKITNTGYGDYPEDEYTYMYVDNPAAFTAGKSVTVYSSDGTQIGSFTPQIVESDRLSEQYITTGGMYDFCSDVVFAELGCSIIAAEEYAIGKTYYFEGASGEEYIQLPFINPGDNVAWTGSCWDVLAGSVDMSAYATDEDVARAVNSAVGEALEGEY